MRDAKFEHILANHCSPVLMGTKLSNLISVSKMDFASNEEFLSNYKSLLKPYGIAIEKLCECEERMQLFVYNEERLARHLKKSRIAKFLSEYGYESSDLDVCISVLKSKLRHFVTINHNLMNIVIKHFFFYNLLYSFVKLSLNISIFSKYSYVESYT